MILNAENSMFFVCNWMMRFLLSELISIFYTHALTASPDIFYIAKTLNKGTAFATNSDFLISISLQSNMSYRPWFYKLRILFHQVKNI